MGNGASPSKPGLLQRLMEYYCNLGLDDRSDRVDRFAQALMIMGFCALGGLVFIFLFAFQVPYQMTFYTNITNATITPPLTFWNSAFTVISIFGAGALVAGASFLIGGLLGFLFGIPKSIEIQSGKIESITSLDDSKQDFYQENTNLEDISDWLTKIIIGVGLVELTTIPQYINQYASTVAPALGGIPSSGAVGIAIFVYYSVIGFLYVYICTRAYMESGLESMKRKELINLEKELELKREKNKVELAKLELTKRDAEGRVKDLEQKENELRQTKQNHGS